MMRTQDMHIYNDLEAAFNTVINCPFQQFEGLCVLASILFEHLFFINGQPDMVKAIFLDCLYVISSEICCSLLASMG